MKIGDQVKVIDYRSEHFGTIGKIEDILLDDQKHLINNIWYKEPQLAPAHTLDALTPGDVMVDSRGNEQTVLERFTQTVLLSKNNDYNPDIVWQHMTIKELKKAGYTLKNTPKETIEEVMVEEAINKIDAMALSYKKLEETGHIPKGAVTDNVNWGEIKELITKALGKAIKN